MPRRPDEEMDPESKDKLDRACHQLDEIFPVPEAFILVTLLEPDWTLCISRGPGVSRDDAIHMLETLVTSMKQGLN